MRSKDEMEIGDRSPKLRGAGQQPNRVAFQDRQTHARGGEAPPMAQPLAQSCAKVWSSRQKPRIIGPLRFPQKPVNVCRTTRQRANTMVNNTSLCRLQHYGYSTNGGRDVKLRHRDDDTVCAWGSLGLGSFQRLVYDAMILPLRRICTPFVLCPRLDVNGSS